MSSTLRRAFAAASLVAFAAGGTAFAGGPQPPDLPDCKWVYTYPAGPNGPAVPSLVCYG